ncbi:MAG: hypothetical protein QW518_09540 [Thermofilaceae archaeon]
MGKKLWLTNNAQGIRRKATFLFLLALTASVLAAITITNVNEWRIVAMESPLVKLGNSSISPVSSSGWYVYNGLNVTRYSLCFIPGWEEKYDVGALDRRIPGLSASLCREEQVGVAGYRIYLGGQLQVSETQVCGSPVQLPAALSWWTTSSSGYWVLTTARFTVDSVKVKQFINFTAKPMTLLSSASYSCTLYTRSDDFSGACVPVQYTFTESIPDNRTYVTPRSGGSVGIDPTQGNPSPSLYTESKNGYASFFINYSSQPFSASAGFSFQYFFRASLGDDDYLQVHFFIDLNGDRVPDVEAIYYGSGRGTSPYAMASVIYGRSLPTIVRSLPGFVNRPNYWYTITISQVYSTGYVVGLAFTAYSPKGVAKIWWDNVSFTRCAPPSYLGAYVRGGEHTLVYVDPALSPSSPPSVATEVDAYGGTGNPAQDYGVAAAVYDVTRWGAVPAAGFSFTVQGLYLRNATDTRNNVAYVSVGVDSNGDGFADVEYIFYRYDTAGAAGVIVSVHVSPGAVICTVESDGSCTPASPSFKVYNLGSMTSGEAYTWSGSLPPDQQGVVLSVAFAATDASYNAPCTSDDFWVWWDDFSATYYACTLLPEGWRVSGDTYYRSLVPGATVYVGNLSGDGGFYFFDGGLNPVFGVRRSGTAYYARCGGSEVLLGSYPGAYWVDLRLLSGAWEAILRDSSGGILARYSCAPLTAPSYVGFKGVRSFEFSAWGCSG